MQIVSPTLSFQSGTYLGYSSLSGPCTKTATLAQQQMKRHLLIVFFPLYPFLIKIIAFPSSTKITYYRHSLVSNIAYIFAVFYLYKLVRIDFEKEDALRTIIYFLHIPDSLFPACCIYGKSFSGSDTSELLLCEKRQVGTVGSNRMLAAATTRITGIILLPSAGNRVLISNENTKRRNIRKDVLWILVIALGS